MSFRPRGRTPQFADLKGILAQYKEPDNALYQTVQLIIERLDQLKDNIQNQINNIITTTANKLGTFLTASDETTKLPNSKQLVAGQGVTLDTSTPNKMIINVTIPVFFSEEYHDDTIFILR